MVFFYIFENWMFTKTMRVEVCWWPHFASSKSHYSARNILNFEPRPTRDDGWPVKRGRPGWRSAVRPRTIVWWAKLCCDEWRYRTIARAIFEFRTWTDARWWMTCHARSPRVALYSTASHYSMTWLVSQTRCGGRCYRASGSGSTAAAVGRQRYLHFESHRRPTSPDDGRPTTLYRL